MPTKPSLTYTYATNVNYTAGPFVGSPTKVVPVDIPNGFIPGQGVPSAHHNYLWNISGQWISDWLDLGTSAADLDAHIVETDADGKSNLAALELGNTASSNPALVVRENTAAASSASFFTNSAGGYCILANSTGAASTIRGVHTGTGPALEGLALGTDNVGVSGTGSDAGAGVFAQGGTTGAGLEAQGGVTGGSGAVVTGGTDGIGLEAIATGTEPAVLATNSGANGAGLQVLCPNVANPSAGIEVLHGGVGRGINSQSSLGAAVRGLCTGFGSAIQADQTGSGAGVRSTTAAGIGVDAETAGSANPALRARQVGSGQPAALFESVSTSSGDVRLEPKVVSGMTTEGDLAYDSATDTFAAGNGTSQNHLWMTPAGMAFGSSGNHIDATSTSSVTWTTAATALVEVEAVRTGNIYIQASGRFGWSGAIDNTFRVRLYDVTSSVAIETQTVSASWAAGGGDIDIPWAVQSRYFLPAAGPRTIRLEFQKASGSGSDLEARDCGLHWIGVF